MSLELKYLRAEIVEYIEKCEARVKKEKEAGNDIRVTIEAASILSYKHVLTRVDDYLDQIKLETEIKDLLNDD